MSSQTINNSNVKYLILILQELYSKVKFWGAVGVNMSEIVESTIWFYQNCKLGEENKNLILELLTSINLE